MTQIELIKQLLATENWICGTEFMQNFIPEYRTRINELRKQGYEIATRPCQQHSHKSRTLQEWRLSPKIESHFEYVVPSELRILQPTLSLKNWYELETK